MTPHLGQGACTALLGAEALTRAVAAGPPGPAGLPDALRAYDTERRRSAQRVAFASRNLHRFMTGRYPALRDALVRGAGAALHRVGEGRWRASGT